MKFSLLIVVMAKFASYDPRRLLSTSTVRLQTMNVADSSSWQHVLMTNELTSKLGIQASNQQPFRWKRRIKKFLSSTVTVTLALACILLLYTRIAANDIEPWRWRTHFSKDDYGHSVEQWRSNCSCEETTNRSHCSAVIDCQNDSIHDHRRSHDEYETHLQTNK